MPPKRPSFLSSLPPAESRRLTWGAARRRLARDDILFLAGETCTRIYLVKHGLIKLCARDPEGRQAVLDVASGGDLLGASDAALGEPHHHDAVALTNASVLALDAGEFLRTMAARPETALVLLEALARQVKTFTQMSVERAAHSTRARVAGRLLHLGDKLGFEHSGRLDAPLPLRHEELGHFAGASRERTTKEMTWLRRNGIVEYGGGRLRIYRRDLLEALRCGARDAGSSRSADGEGPARSRSRSGT